jgi:hypothetical protein
MVIWQLIIMPNLFIFHLARFFLRIFADELMRFCEFYLRNCPLKKRGMVSFIVSSSGWGGFWLCGANWRRYMDCRMYPSYPCS